MQRRIAIVKPPLPIELSTRVIAWHDVHASPACASGVSSARDGAFNRR